MTLIVQALAVLGSWIPVAGPSVAPIKDPMPKHHKRPKPDPPMSTALASWYAQDGPGACGYGAQSGLRFANRTMRCGTRVLFCYRGCVTAVMSDRGPFVYSRLFDLNTNLRSAIGCPDLCSVRWRVS